MGASGFTVNFTAVGKPAPPRPTRPAARAAATRLCASVTCGGTQCSSGVCAPSGTITTAGTSAPFGIFSTVTSLTVPETPEWISAPTKPLARPTTVPTFTVSPFFTATSHGAPMCWLIGSTIFAGSGITCVALPAVFFLCGTAAPFALRARLQLIFRPPAFSSSGGHARPRAFKSHGFILAPCFPVRQSLQWMNIRFCCAFFQKNRLCQAKNGKRLHFHPTSSIFYHFCHGFCLFLFYFYAGCIAHKISSVPVPQAPCTFPAGYAILYV